VFIRWGKELQVRRMREERTEIRYCYKFQCKLEVSELRFDFRILFTTE